MGASQKRKDARKRKFGDLDASIVDDATTVSPRRKQGKKVSPANDTIKRQKTDLENVPLSLDETEAEIINVEESPEVLRTDDSEPNDQNPTKSNKQKSKPSESVTQTESKTKSQTKERFIVFIGNLPYNTTTTTLQSHFAAVRPTAIRHNTNKETGKSKGFAFLEFDAYDRMKTCLALFHHSIFHGESKGLVEGGDDGGGEDALEEKSGKKEKSRKKDENEDGGRRINVELTAGGGGTKSKFRRTRLKEKNSKLNEERGRRRKTQIEEAKAQGKEITEGDAAGGQAQGNEQVGQRKKVVTRGGRREKKGGGDDGAVLDEQESAGDIHPSRRGRVLGH